MSPAAKQLCKRVATGKVKPRDLGLLRTEINGTVQLLKRIPETATDRGTIVTRLADDYAQLECITFLACKNSPETVDEDAWREATREQLKLCEIVQKLPDFRYRESSCPADIK